MSLGRIALLQLRRLARAGLAKLGGSIPVSAGATFPVKKFGFDRGPKTSVADRDVGGRGLPVGPALRYSMVYGDE